MTGFTPRPARVRFVVDRAAWDRYLSHCFGFSLLSQTYSLLIHSSVTPVQESQQLTESLNDTFDKASWKKRDRLDVTCLFISLFNAQHVSNVNTSILRSLRLICRVISWVVLLCYDVCWCYVVVWLGCCGIRMQAEACIRIPQHPSQTTT